MNKRTPYWQDYLYSEPHRLGLMAGLAVSVMASLPWGGNAFVLGLLATVAIDIVGAVLVPSLPVFRAWADKKERTEVLAETKKRLQEEIQNHGGSIHLDSFAQMTNRVASLHRMANDPSSTLKLHDVRQLEDATLDYLRLCLSDAVLQSSMRKGNDTSGLIEDRLDEVRSTLSNGNLSAQETHQLRKAEAGFVAALTHQSRMSTRRAALDASLYGMPVRMEEIYQMVMTAPSAGNLGSLLEESLARLRITEEVSLDLDIELGLGLDVPAITRTKTLTGGSTSAGQGALRPAARADSTAAMQPRPAVRPQAPLTAGQKASQAAAQTQRPQSISNTGKRPES